MASELIESAEPQSEPLATRQAYGDALLALGQLAPLLEQPELPPLRVHVDQALDVDGAGAALTRDAGHLKRRGRR